jgi:hypothetical protein
VDSVTSRHVPVVTSSTKPWIWSLWARFDPGDRPTNIGVDVPERLERERRADTGLVLDRGPQIVVAKK